MLSVAENLANGIRRREHRTIQYAFEQGACPNAVITLHREERFGANQAPVIYLAIHYDMPDVVRDLLHRGADTQRTTETGLTPRAHAAWRFRWECLDAFDIDGVRMNDHEMVISAIISHWCEARPDPGLEAAFFKRIDRLPGGYLPPPDLGLRMLVGALCAGGSNADTIQRLLEHSVMHQLGQRVREAMQLHPTRFVPYLSQWGRSGQKERSFLPDDVLDLLARHDIDLTLPENTSINDEARGWISTQQQRIDAARCQRQLQSATVPAGEQGKSGRGRL